MSSIKYRIRFHSENNWLVIYTRPDGISTIAAVAPTLKLVQEALGQLEVAEAERITRMKADCKACDRSYRG